MGKVLFTAGGQVGACASAAPRGGPLGAAHLATRTRSRGSRRARLTSALRALALVVGSLALGTGPAWAQCSQSNVLNYSTAATGSRKTGTETVSNTSVTYNGYASTSPTTRTFGVQTATNLSGTSLVWQEDNQGVPLPNQASMTLTFSRPVDNLTLRLQDLDADAAAYFRDNLRLDGYPTATGGSPATLTAGNFTLGTKNAFAGANTVRGTAAGAAGDATANVTVTFSTPVQRLVLTYSNDFAYTAGVARQQTLGINSIAWCAQADVQTTLAGPARAQAGSTVAYTATTRNVSGDQVTTIRPTVQLPTGLANVTGGTYVSATGVLTLPVVSNLASGASVAQAIGYTMPAINAVTATATFTSTASDPVATNNSSTITTAQNRAPVASDVTNAPAILRTLTTPTNIAAFNASDPDATAGNTTLTSFTILTLPNAAQGRLFVNGVAATAGQVITVPATATATAPGYQLSFVPTSTATGSATFTYRATDDTNTASNVATYTVPVTAGADLSSTISGLATGVVGQSKSYSITVSNNGPEDATNVVPTLTLSNKPPFSSVTVPSGGSYDPNTGIVTFSPIASLASGAAVVNSLALVVQPIPASFSLTAANTAATADPVPANNNGTAAAANLTVTVSPIGPAGLASACAFPGSNGSATLTANPNTYFPAGNQTVTAGATSLVVGPAVGTAPIAAGDLLLVIQMQGADLNTTNTDAYGDGVAGGLATSNLTNANFTAGLYEYVVAAAPVPLTGGTLTLTTGLRNGYQNADATGLVGQRRFQVVRIPQYKDLTVSGTVAPSAWDGRTGGILALDVAGQLTFETGARLDASGKGFRGGAGQRLTGTTGLTGTDYRAAASASGTTTTGAHAMKGEGIAGTPRYVNTGADLLDTGTEGYPSGSAGRGGPGNGGGGGTDANPTANDQNSGGGGGGNGSRGGRGGNAWSSGAASGGESGAPFNLPSSSRLVLGGGGGAGSTNDGSGGGPSAGYASSGAAGGGLVLVRTGSVRGAGAVLANGASASSAVLNDGSGGGGAGGSILLTANNTASLTSLTLAANGGSGGTNTGNGMAHGPGGGGGGGIVLTNAAVASANALSGASGTTAGGVAFGAAAGLPGLANTQISNSIANSTAGINCIVDVTAVLTAPASAASGQSVALSAVFANNGGVDAASATRTVTLSSGSASNPFTTVSAPGGTISGLNTEVVTITYPSVAPLTAGASSAFNLSYTAPGTAGITATAAITTPSAEALLDNNTSTATTAITGFADVVSAVFGLNSSLTGQPTASYAVVFANNGPAAAAGVTRTVQLPAGATLSPAQLSAITAQGGTYAAGIINFGNTTLTSRQAQTFNFGYTAPATAGTANIVSTITTTSPQDASNGPGAAPDVFAFAVNNNPASDLATDGVTVSNASVAVGQTASFVVKYTNFGPSLTTNALRLAQLTPGLTGVVVTDYNGTVLSGAYNAITGIVMLPNVTLPSGGTAYATLAFTAPASGPVSVSGSMSGGVGSISSGIYGNNQATASIAVTPVTDVQTTISGPAAGISGNLVTFVVTTASNGPSPAADVVQTVQLPANLSGVFATSGGIYSPSTGLVTFPALAVLASGAAVTNKVSFPLAATLTATAAVRTTTPEAAGTTANNSATAATTTAAAATPELANVFTTLAISEKSVAPGAPVTFTIETGNAGPASAQGVVQQLALRPGLSVPAANISNGGTYDAATGIVTFPALAKLASGATVVNTVLIAAPALGPVIAAASVTAATSDPVPADNLALRNVDVRNVADLAVTLVGPGIAAVTQPATTFLLTMRNNGPVPARDAVATVAIPAGLAPASVTASNNGVYDPATGLITWPVVTTLAVGEGRSYSYTYVAPAYASTDAAAPRTVVSLASVSSTTPDGNPANNTASVATLIRWNADVTVAVAGPVNAVVGNAITFAVTTANNGPAPAPSLTPTVRIATDLSSVMVSGGGTYDATTGLVTFPTISNLPAGNANAVVNTITLIVPDRPIIGVSAAVDVANATNDANQANNAATLTLPVIAKTTDLVDLQTTIAANLTSQQAGQPIVLTVTATNSAANGNTTASSLRERVYLNAGLSRVAVTDASGNALAGAYDPVSGAVTFPLANNVPAGTTLTYTITVSDASQDLVATANVNGNFSDPVPTNNSQVARVTILPVADVALRVSGPATLLPGALATYTVTTLNNGPSVASAVGQTVQLPTGLSGVAVSGGGTYSATTGLVTFPTIATQVAGAAGAVTNTISFTFPTTATTLTGTATTGTSESVGGPVSNTSALTTTLANQPPLASTFANRLQSPQGNTATALTLTALSGYDPDGAIGSFTIASLPAAAAGQLLLGGAPVVVGQSISLADEANLQFDPLATFVGTASFTYTATDNQDAVSMPAVYTIVVGQDNTALYTSTELKGGTAQYQNGDVITNVFDANGGTYNATAVVTDNGVRTATVSSSTLAPGLELDPSTGQVRVFDRSLLVAGTYPVGITTIDVNGGITTQTVSLRIGDYPLPVELTAFQVRAVGQDAQLSWATAQELNNKGFRVERSFDGVSFVALGFVAGAGNTTQPQQYGYTEVGVGRQHRGAVYYRLQQLDLSGKASYSPVRAVSFAPEALSLFPNPATTATTLDLSSLPTATYEVTLVDMTGRVVQVHALAGGRAHELAVSSLPTGAYLVLVRGNGQKLVCRLIKE